MMPRRKVLLLLAVAGMVGLSGCGYSRYSYTPGQSHVVRGGETLVNIATRYGKDHRELARWNGLGDGSLIYPGQVIRLTAPHGSTVASRPARQAPTPKRVVPPPSNDPSPKWVWPTRGRIVAEFNGQQGSGTGLAIAGKAGQSVRAAASGRVVYSGGGLIGYGQLIIIKHNDTYLSAYGHNASRLVREGETIRQGQRIATMGEGPGQEPRLHFEIRRDGKPVNPRQFLPAN